MPNNLKGKKILAIHFRVGKTDGVSLEIDAWKKIWQKVGLKVELCAGPYSEGADYIITDLEQQLDPSVFRIDEESFSGFKTFRNKDEYEKEFLRISNIVKSEFKEVLVRSKPDFLVISNIFSVGENLPAVKALAETLSDFKIPTVAVHHDFYWENSRYSDPSTELVENLLDSYFPPKYDFIKHACINSIAQKELEKRKLVSSIVMPDTLDFTNTCFTKKEECKKILAERGVTEDDFIVLQATRVVRRKNIEIAIDYCSELNKSLSLLGKKRLVFVMSSYAEKRDEWYLDKIIKYAKRKKVKTVYLNGYYGKGCEMMDIYPFADLITYPSEYEGFGNQFLEAVCFKKPVVIFEYPVFQKDIKPLGFEYISLGNEVYSNKKTGLMYIPSKNIKFSVGETIDLLSNSIELKKITENNFRIAKENYSYEKTAERWLKILND